MQKKLSKLKTTHIALFGGSFNPPHIGHLEIAKRVGRRKRVDSVWVLPTYCHPFGKKLAPFTERLEKCRQLFKGIDKVKVKDWEMKKGGMSYTLDLILFLKKKFPAYQFSWVMGNDDYAERDKWKDFSAIERLVKIIVFPRGENSPIPNISSTEIRKNYDEWTGAGIR